MTLMHSWYEKQRADVPSKANAHWAWCFDEYTGIIVGRKYLTDGRTTQPRSTMRSTPSSAALCRMVNGERAELETFTGSGITLVTLVEVILISLQNWVVK